MNTSILRNLSKIPNNNKLLRGYANLLDASIPEDLYRDAFSTGQLTSKMVIQQMCDTLPKTPTNICICGGWIGLSSAMLLDMYPSANVYSIDKSKHYTQIADVFNREEVANGWRFKAVESDIFDLDFTDLLLQPWSNVNQRNAQLKPKIDLIINTSTEHMERYKLIKWFNSIPHGTYVLLQSNDFFKHHEHINCVYNITELKTMLPMRNLYSEDVTTTQKYHRFTIIGQK